MCNTKIKKYTCKLAKSIKKYIDLVSYGISKKCDYKDIKLKKALINILKRNQECCTDCSLEGKYEFVLPGNQIGYIEFLCYNLGYLHIPGQLPKKITYDYYNNQLIYDLGEFTTETQIQIQERFYLFEVDGESPGFYGGCDLLGGTGSGQWSLEIYDSSNILIFTSPTFENNETYLWEDLVNDFNTLSPDGYTMLSENGYIFILDGEGNYISEQVMYINIGRDGTCGQVPVYSSPGILEVEVEVEVQIPITYTTDITFDDDCNIIGEFDFDLYCYTDSMNFNINGLTLNWDGDFIVKIQVGEYILEIPADEYIDFQSVIDLWNSLYPNVIIESTIDGDNVDLVFYVSKDLNLCEEDIFVYLVKGFYTPATTEYDFSLLELPPVEFTLEIVLDNVVLYSNNFETDSLLEFLNDVVSDFNNLDNGYTMVLENETIIITTPNGSEYNDLVFTFDFLLGEELVGQITFPETQDGESPEEPQEYSILPNNNYLVDTLTKIPTPCKTNCLTEDEIKTITDYLDK
jgi:hypothetical protein